jgi:hypothetical protein
LEKAPKIANNHDTRGKRAKGLGGWSITSVGLLFLLERLLPDTLEDAEDEARLQRTQEAAHEQELCHFSLSQMY